MVDGANLQRLNALFSPRSIAVIGASSRSGSLGNAVFNNIITNGYTGSAYPVNPKAEHILGVAAYPSVLAIPDDVDLAVLLVPASSAFQTLEECGQKGIKAAVVVTAGFKEMGPEGAMRESELKRIADQHGVRLLGPNCLGLINTDKTVSLNTTFAAGMPKAGNIAFISQSGALGAAALEYARRHGIGFSKFVSFGNKVDLNENDLLAYLSHDPHTKVMLLYLEDLDDPQAFHKLGREITRAHKPIVALKAGRTSEGAKAASSHTGALASSDHLYEVLFRQSGVLRAEGLEEFFGYALALVHQPLPDGNRVAIVTNAGGPGILETDAAVRSGLKLAALSDTTKTKLKQHLPPSASVNNPIDMTGEPDEARYETTLQTVLKDPAVDGAVVMTAPHILMDLEKIVRSIVKGAAVARNKKPVLASLVAVTDERPAAEVLEAADIPHYVFPGQASNALGAMVRFRQWLQHPEPVERPFADVRQRKAKQLITTVCREGRKHLSEPEAHQMLGAYGFPLLSGRHARNVEEAAQVAADIGYPVALKVVSPKILHKVDAGGVALNLENESALQRAYAQLLENVSRYHDESDVQGVFVQQMALSGLEIILGLNRDPHFGPLLMFGLGGTQVEIFRDVTFRMTPIDAWSARQMIEDIRGHDILKGYRNQPPVDIEMLIECLLRLSQLAVDLPEIRELDINPLRVFERDKGAAVVDARITLQ